ncbi:hypothetical protein Vi05172_g9027 [Venturia inaequalis]|nr:hypothetical protein Vi05172_g9027 [Venturia inaequalis]
MATSSVTPESSTSIGILPSHPMPAKLAPMDRDRPRNTIPARNGYAPLSPSFDSEDDTAAGALGEPLIHDFATRSIPKEYKPFTAKDSDTHSIDLPMQRPPALIISDDDEEFQPRIIYNSRSAEQAYRPRSSRYSAQTQSIPREPEAVQSHHRRQPEASRQQLRQRTSEPTSEAHMDQYSGSSAPSTPRSHDHYSPDPMGYETGGSSTDNLPALQVKQGVVENDRLEPVLEDDPASFDLLPQAQAGGGSGFQLESRSDTMFSREHLEEIFKDRTLLLQFTNFLSANRPKSIPILVYYLDALKALRAISYANSLADSLGKIDGHDFANDKAGATINSALEKKAEQAFETLVRDDLPAYITHTFISVVSLSIQRRITGTLAPHLRESSEGLAEVFCLTDPSRPDNPIVFASEEFHRTTQYGVSYAIGRNCRFLQGPRTNLNSVRRFAKGIKEGKEVSEVFLNYRRDGSPFMNMLMVAPLLDSRGNCRYFIGAQVDVSGLCKDCTDLQALQRLLVKEDRKAHPENYDYEEEQEPHKDEFQALAEVLSGPELEVIRRHGGKMHSQHVEDPTDIQLHDRDRPRLLLKDQVSTPTDSPRNAFISDKFNGKLEGIYQNYLLVRPYPSLRILFSSPSLRVPGILQSPFLNRIGGSSRVRDELTAALAEGRGVTAKVRWISSRSDEEGRARWIHCTPLLGGNGSVGVWMVVIVDDEVGGGSTSSQRRFRMAPPVDQLINGKIWGRLEGAVWSRLLFDVMNERFYEFRLSLDGKGLALNLNVFIEQAAGE